MFMISLKNKIFIYWLVAFLWACPFVLEAQNEMDGAEPTDTVQAVVKKTIRKSQREVTITGHVFDAATGAPVNAAELTAENYASAITNEDGSFSIRIPYPSAILKITSWGYQTKELAVRGNETVTIRMMKSKYTSLYEREILPLGEKNVVDATFATNHTDRFFPVAGSSLQDRLQMELGEMRTIIRSGAPGIGGNMFVRGYNSMTASSQPMILVDGIPYETLLSNRISSINGWHTDPLTNIDPEDIEDISIIKDGYALYGMKAANGVIAITTKRAKEQTSKIAVTASWGMNFAPKQLPVLDASEYRALVSEQMGSAGFTPIQIMDAEYLYDDPSRLEYHTYHNDTDWQDEIFRNGFIQNYHGQVTGGDDIAKYGISLGYMNVQSTLNSAALDRFNTRFNTDIDLLKNLQMSLGVAYSQANKTMNDDGTVIRSSPSFLSLMKSPLVASHKINTQGVQLATLADEDIWGVSNPVFLQTDAVVSENDQYRLGLYGKLNLKLGSAWLLNATFSYDYDKYEEAYFIPDYGVSSELLPRSEISKRYTQSAIARYVGLYGNFAANYNKLFDYIHHVNVWGGVRYQGNELGATRLSGHNVSEDSKPFLESGMIGKSIRDYDDKWKWASAYVDAEYTLKNRYQLAVSVSGDGTSRAGENQQYSVFPSVALSWNLASESFMSWATALNVLKFRASSGMVGNDNFSFLNAVQYFQSVAYLDAQGTQIANLGNKNLKWETTTKNNLGVDIALFNERISLAADFYVNKTKDLITPQSLDHASGFPYAFMNGGDLENTGLELKLGLRWINTRDFRMDTRFSFAKYKNEITSLPGGKDIETTYLGANILSRVGQPVGVFYGYKSSGVFATAKEAHDADLSAYYRNTRKYAFEAGDVRFEDVNNDHLIDEEDLQIIGDPNPDFYGSVAFNFEYKNVGLDATFTGVYGNDVYNHLRAQTESMRGFYNQSTSVLNRWRVEGQQTSMPRADYYDLHGNSRFSDRWIEDGSYLRLKNVTLTWKNPKKLFFLEGLSVFVTANNLFVVTDYLGGDPEFSASSFSLFQGIDAGYLSQGRSFTAGFKINL